MNYTELDRRLVQVVPSPRQFAYQQLEFYAFVHFTVNTFSGGRKFISGNRCEKPVTGVKSTETKYNMFEEKRRLLARYTYKLSLIHI